MARRKEEMEVSDLSEDDSQQGSDTREMSRSPSVPTYDQLWKENEELKRRINHLEDIIEEQNKKLEKHSQIMEVRHHQLMTAITGKSETTKRKIDSDDDDEVQRKPPTKIASQVKRTTPPPQTSNQASSQAASSQAEPEQTTTGRKQDQGQVSKKLINSPPTNIAKIPPIVLVDKEKWMGMSSRLKQAKIKYVKARTTKNGISVEPASVEDYRAMIKVCAAEKWQHHTYSLPEEKPLRVVIRGIPANTDTEAIKADLQDQGFAPNSVQPMTSRRTKQPMPLYLVQLPQDQTDIMNLNRCCSLVVKIEKQHKQTEPTQCHRCQKFGHSQKNCTAQARCVKCSGAHHTGDCTKSRDTAAKCANCKGDHPASYRGCPSAPKRQQPKRDDTTKTQEGNKTQTAPRQWNTQNGRSYAQAAGQRKQPKPEEEKMGKMQEQFDQIQKMFAAMQAFMAQMTSFTN